MRFRKGDKARDEKDEGEWFVDRIDPRANRIHYRRSGQDGSVYFSKEDLDLIRREQSDVVIP